MTKIAFKTLGCRLNQFETDSVFAQFYKAGYQIVDFNVRADVYVINTCTVTGQSDVKSRRAIQHAKRMNPEALMVVTGCLVSHPDEKAKGVEDIDYIIPNDRKISLFPLVDAHLKGELLPIENLPASKFDFEPAEKTMHTRSFIKIQDGCDNFCSFCIVPTVRGRAISRPVQDILDHIKKLLDFGYKELVLTGVNIGRYEDKDQDFESLLSQILNIDGDFRLRISSMEPEGIGERFFDLLQHPRLCPHLHLCLQSGSDRILQEMERMYSLGDYLNLIEKIRKHIPDFNFTTDIMVGFPGETEADFQQSLHVISEVGFSHVHTFKYSIREGTKAAIMPQQIPEKCKTERSKQVRLLSEENKSKYYQSFIGKAQDILIERILKNGTAKGYGQHYMPCEVKGEELRVNEFVRGRLTEMYKIKDGIILRNYHV